MNNWKKIWESREDTLGKIDKENYREVFAELKKIDGFDLNGGVNIDSQILQHKNLKYHIMEKDIILLKILILIKY